MNVKLAFVLVFCLIGLALAKPWIQGPGRYTLFEHTFKYDNCPQLTAHFHAELALPREVNPEQPIERHADDCKIYYIYNFPMTCGEGQGFSKELLACVAEAEAGC